MKGKFVIVAVFTILTMVILIVGCVPTSTTTTTAPTSTPSQPLYGGKLIVLVNEVTAIGYPALPAAAQNSGLSIPVVETLLKYDKSGKPIPFLATGVVGDFNTKTYLITLNKGIKFHDGTDLNATAVKFNLELQMTEKAVGAKNFKSIDIVDDYTVRINLSKWDNTIEDNLAQSLGAVISPAAFTKNGKDWCVDHAVGTGPFQFVSWTKNVNMMFKKWDGYWQKGKPYVDQIEYKFIADQLTQEMSFKAGEIDLFYATLIPAITIQTLEKEGYPISRTITGSGADGLVPSSGVPNSPFANVKVRQAAAYAIDCNAIVKSVLLGEAQAPNQYDYVGHWGYNPSVIGYPYDPNKAKQLLAEAGYPNGFKTQITYGADREKDDIHMAVQGFLKVVGIDATLNSIARPSWSSMLNGGKWDGLCMGIQGASVDVLSNIVINFTASGRYMSTAYPSDYLKAISDAQGASDFATKQKYVWEIQKSLIDKYALYIPLNVKILAAASQKYVHNHGARQSPVVTWTPEEVWMDKK